VVAGRFEELIQEEGFCKTSNSQAHVNFHHGTAECRSVVILHPKDKFVYHGCNHLLKKPEEMKILGVRTNEQEW
jgi:predicted RNA binding protein YcfA (HicA-like mRNA interferase family)